MSPLINPLDSARQQLYNGYEYLKGEYDAQFPILLSPERVIEVSIPVTMDDGSVRVFTGYRSQHCGARGPYKGGIRYHHDVSRDEVMALSTWMSIKTAMLDLPLGGGKGGIIVEVKELSEGELERLTRGYIAKVYKYLGKSFDVPGPDMNTNGQVMAWMADEYSRLVGGWTPGVVTGKPLEAGGSLGRANATAQGGFFVLDSYLRAHSENIRGKKIVIQGAGNAGLNFLELLVEAGAVIVGISDSRVGLSAPYGLDSEEIIALKEAKKSFSEYTGKAEKITNAELLELPCDILVPAAIENQITRENAPQIRAGLILELANGPTTPEADQILFSRSIAVIPDILANAGGVTVSYFEQIQNNMNYYWSAEEVQEKLKLKMEKAITGVLQMSREKGVMLRTGAYIIAMKRILDAMKTRGM